jgi:hypothetical protein
VLLAKQKQKNMIDFEKTPLGQIPSQWSQYNLMIWFAVQEDANDCFFGKKHILIHLVQYLLIWSLSHLSNWCSTES